MTRVLLTLLLLPACEPEPIDWCVERQDEEAVHAEGTLQVDYQGRLTKGPVSIDPYVKTPIASVIITKGCATDGQGTLWAFHGGWLIPEGSSFPLQLGPESGDEPSFYARLFLCANEDCGSGETPVTGLFQPRASGEVLVFDPVAGLFSGKGQVINARGEAIDVDASLSWVPRLP